MARTCATPPSRNAETVWGSSSAVSPRRSAFARAAARRSEGDAPSRFVSRRALAALCSRTRGPSGPRGPSITSICSAPFWGSLGSGASTKGLDGIAPGSGSRSGPRRRTTSPNPARGAGSVSPATLTTTWPPRATAVPFRVAVSTSRRADQREPLRVHHVASRPRTSKTSSSPDSAAILRARSRSSTSGPRERTKPAQRTRRSAAETVRRRSPRKPATTAAREAAARNAQCHAAGGTGSETASRVPAAKASAAGTAGAAAFSDQERFTAAVPARRASPRGAFRGRDREG